MPILFCTSFLKSLKKIRSIDTNDICALLTKYPNTTEIKIIDKYGEYEILKCYLSGKRVRVIVFVTIAKGKYVPFAVVKKESKKGRNITKDNYIELFSGDITRVLKDVRESNYETEDI